MENITELVSLIKDCKKELGKTIVGHQKIIDAILISILADGHLLIEGLPGLGKTLLVKSLSDILDLDFKRIQFMPDLLPSDIVGNMIYNQQQGEFIPKKGPIFSNVVLADEVNRAPSKVQSALLQAMEEKQVTIGNITYQLPEHFFVLATENPIDQEGTYNLPEAQIDRFIMKVLVTYPSKDEEFFILKENKFNQENQIVRKIIGNIKLKEIKDLVSQITVDDKIISYIIDIVRASRTVDNKNSYSSFISHGASPRASISLFKCIKANALLNERSYVLPEDVKYIAPAILRHRIILNYEAESEGLSTDDIIKMILQNIAVP